MGRRVSTRLCTQAGRRPGRRRGMAVCAQTRSPGRELPALKEHLGQACITESLQKRDTAVLWETGGQKMNQLVQSCAKIWVPLVKWQALLFSKRNKKKKTTFTHSSTIAVYLLNLLDGKNIILHHFFAFQVKLNNWIKTELNEPKGVGKYFCM